MQNTSMTKPDTIVAWLREPVVSTGIVRLEGGLVNSVFRLEFDRPPGSAVVKLHGHEGDDFGAEARALEHLATTTACPGSTCTTAPVTWSRTSDSTV